MGAMQTAKTVNKIHYETPQYWEDKAMQRFRKIVALDEASFAFLMNDDDSFLRENEFESTDIKPLRKLIGTTDALRIIKHFMKLERIRLKNQNSGFENADFESIDLELETETIEIDH